MLDPNNWTECTFPDCRVSVPVPTGCADALCFDHGGLLARRVNQSVGPDRDAAIADFRRRVMGLDS